MQIVNVPLGSEGSVQVNFSQGNVSLSIAENTPGLTGAIQVNLPVTYFVDALVKKLGSSPTEVAVAALIDGVLKGLA